ncbi:MAG TPA: hypothetical protein VNL77_16535 [Roseiflexaceae bacterium]|nr:hypothetical protein [Roseiflexaceae bacterium]
MKARYDARSASGTKRSGILFWLLALLLAGASAPAHAAGVTWYVTSPNDSAEDGDLATRSGSLRFTLTHATSGDLISFARLPAGVTTIVASSTLAVPAGVSVGRDRKESCGSYTTPLVNVEDTTRSVNPVFSLGAGATLRNINIGGGDISLQITGPDVDVCAVGIGVEYYPNQSPHPRARPPKHAALIINGAHATIRRSYINGAVVVTTRGSDTRIGDALDGEGDSNDGVRAATVTVLADAAGAAQRVTIRDPFPRALVGMPGDGVAGGDDLFNHANNWAQTPAIISAETYDNFATVEVRGVASPHSLVDIYLDNQITVARQPPVMADDTGSFHFSGSLPYGPQPILAIAASTLDDPAHPSRVGSSSEWSQAVQVRTAQPSPSIQLAPAGLLFTALVPGPNPPPQHLLVTMPPTDGAWQTTVTMADGGNWLSATPSGSGSGPIAVAVDASALAPGSYHGTVTVTAVAQPWQSASASVTVIVQSSERLLAATGGVIDLSGPPAGPAHPGDVLRFTVTMTNVGTLPVTSINSTVLQIPPSVDIVAGSGTVRGEGSGFTATDEGFSGGTLAPGRHAAYSLDSVVKADVTASMAVFSIEVNGEGIITIPVVGRMRLAPRPAAALQPVMWAPLVGE